MNSFCGWGTIITTVLSTHSCPPTISAETPHLTSPPPDTLNPHTHLPTHLPSPPGRYMSLAPTPSWRCTRTALA
jgi:hypothetical protein